MPTLPPDTLKKAHDFIQTNCRPLELARFEFLFNHGSSDKVLEELKKFQNPDGGFGHGLEPDSTHPESSPLATTIAFQILEDLKSPDLELIKKAVEYFENTFDKDRHGWFAMDDKVNNYPHAIWWNWDPVKRQTPIDEHWGNPTAEIVGYLFKYRQFLKTLDIDELVNFTINYWVNQTEFKSEHEAYCFIRLHKNLPKELAKKLEPNLIKATQKLVAFDKNKWSQYLPQPLHFTSSPDFFLYNVVKDSINENLDYLISSVTSDGVWLPHWTWYQYDQEWEIQKIVWSGILTIQNLKTLRAYHRID